MSARASIVLVAFLVPLLSSALSAQIESYDDVMLIVNDRSTASKDIGTYFASRRGIPDWHVCHIDVDSSESMDSATFVSLKWRIQEWMRSHNLVDSINYIVTTKGCPLRARASFSDGGSGFSGTASFEDLLVLINGIDSVRILAPRSGLFVNRYYGATTRFRRNPTTLPMYLVTRLDAYTVDQVKSYILRAETPAVLGDGLWVLDVAPGRDNPSYRAGNDWLRNAAAILRSKGLNVFLDTSNTYVHDQENVLGYGSWGSNDGSSGGGQPAIPRNTWLNGSIAETIVSTSGRSFRPGTSYGQSLIADWVAEGACGVKGYTDEPYLTSIAHFDIAFDRYTSGWNLAESFFAASQLSAWRQVVIGDPKMKLGRLLASSVLDVDLGSGYRWVWIRDTVSVRVATTGAVEITALTTTGGDSLDFAASAVGGSLPRTLAAGDSLRIEVRFRPSVYRKEVSTLSVAHRRPSSPNGAALLVALSGTGLRPVLSVDDTVDFGLAPGSSAVRRGATIRNLTSSDTLEVRTLRIDGTDKTRFSIDTSSISLPVRIAGGDSLTIPIDYHPNGVASHTATLTVSATSQFPVAVRLIGQSSTSGILLATDHRGDGIREIAPNPAASSVRVTLRNAWDGGTVTLDLVDALGRVASRRDLGKLAAGERSVDFDVTTLPSGHYLCRLSITRGRETALFAARLVVTPW